jgi:hypothetical protein
MRRSSRKANETSDTSSLPDCDIASMVRFFQETIGGKAHSGVWGDCLWRRAAGFQNTFVPGVSGKWAR